MSKVVNYRVKVHTCKLGREKIPFIAIQPGNRYVLEDIKLDYDSNYYEKLAPRCRCRRYIRLFDANEKIQRGEAHRVLRCKKGKIVEDEYQIWMPVVRVTSKTAKVPRIDLVTKADIERAYIYNQKQAIELIEQIHDMIMDNRMKLMAPFREDPFEGRTLFSFTTDERTGVKGK